VKEVVLGVDLGTQGCRVLSIDSRGVQLSSVCESLPPYQSELPAGWHEQDPEMWWGVIASCLQDTIHSLPSKTVIKGIAVDSTSGTLVVVDQEGQVVHSAIMYNDSRSQAVVDDVRNFGAGLETSLGYQFGTSFALPKIVWYLRNISDHNTGMLRFLHAADFVVGHLTGNYSISDYSNALKSGYDVKNGCWPKFIQEDLGISLDSLPTIVTPGKLIGEVTRTASEETLLKAGIPVYAGATDGTAALIASGARNPGDWNSTLGTTLALKGLSKELLVDPKSRIYSHLHPNGLWIPSGASNTGGEWIAKEYPNITLSELDKAAKRFLPTKGIRYPLVRLGERFPFNNPSATGFQLGETNSAFEAFAVGLEGLAMLEKLAFETMSEVGASTDGDVFVTGGGAKSSLWLTIRASTLNRPLYRPKNSECAMGAAILAATGVWYGDLNAATQNMVCIEACYEPAQSLIDAYAEKYKAFIEEMQYRKLI